MAQPTAYEQYMLELVNAERAANGAQPLAFNDDLNDAADRHNDWMLATDTFSHVGAGGSSPLDRAKVEGYAFLGNWAIGENIAWVSTGGEAAYADETAALNQSLMNSPEHRDNLLNPAFSEVGIGINVGDYQGIEGAFVTEDFAKSGDAVYLTGVAFNDEGNKAYDVGEGLGGITVTATDAQGNSFSTTTWEAGGYKLALAQGDYTVTFSKDGTILSSADVTIADRNVDLDYVGDGTTAAPVSETSTPPASDPAQPSDAAAGGQGTGTIPDAAPPAKETATGESGSTPDSSASGEGTIDTASASDAVTDGSPAVDSPGVSSAPETGESSESHGNAERGECGSGRSWSHRSADSGHGDATEIGEASPSLAAVSFDHHSAEQSLEDTGADVWSHSGYAHHDGLWA